MEPLYRIEEESTSGWHTPEPTDVHLTKDQARERINELINLGSNPNRLRAIRE
jgi:hypothetical protein